MSYFIGFVAFGFVIGLIARVVAQSHNPIGFAATTILGVLGALIGGSIGRVLGRTGSSDLVVFLMSTAGAVALILIYHFATRKRPFSTQLRDREFPRRAA